MAKHAEILDEIKINLKSGQRTPQYESYDLFIKKLFNKAIHRNNTKQGKGVTPTAKQYMQNSMVKVSYTTNKHSGQWQSHAKYLQREGAQIEGKKGIGFDETKDTVDMEQRLNSWQVEGDERFFRVIVSPELGDRMNLKEHVRALMKRIEADWNMKIEWVAIEHTNTDNPHVHIAIQGRGFDGQDLWIDRDYIKSGIRIRSKETATQQLGMRLREDVLDRRKKIIMKNRFTELDREILRLSQNAMNVICFAGSLPMNKYETENRLLLIGRLQYLQTLGFVERKGFISWKVSEHLEQGLRTIQMSQDIIKRKSEHLAVITEPDLPAVYTQLKEGDTLIGRLVGFGIHNENSDSRYILLEGVDGQIHYTHPKTSMLKDRAELKIRNGDVVTLEVKSYFINNQKKTYLAFENLGGVTSLKNHQGFTKADEWVLKKFSKDKEFFNINYPEKSFRAKFYSQMKQRIEHFQSLNLIDSQGNLRVQAIREKMK